MPIHSAVSRCAPITVSHRAAPASRCNNTCMRCCRASAPRPSSCTTGNRKLRLRLSLRQVRLASNWGWSSRGHWKSACFSVGVSPNMALDRMNNGRRSKAGFSHQKRNIARDGDVQKTALNSTKTGKVTMAQLVISRRRWRWLNNTPRSMASQVGRGRITTLASLRRMAAPSGKQQIRRHQHP